MVVMASSSSKSEEEPKPESAMSNFLDEMEIKESMRNAAIIFHQNEPVQPDGSRVLNVFSPVDISSHTEMIHVSVPDTKTLVDRNDGVSKYIGYNLEINGWYHGCIRFSLLYEFAELIRSKFGQKYKGPEFPPKKMFKLDAKAIEERRQKISKYFQALVQHTDIVRHYVVEKQILGFQIDSFRATSNYVSLDIFKGDGEKIAIKCCISDSTSDIMKIVAEQLGFNNKESFFWNFGLFMARTNNKNMTTFAITSENFDPLLVRLLRNFEAPFISLSTSNQVSAADGIYHFLCIRKLIWDAKSEELFMDDPDIVDLLYRQAAQDFRNNKLSPLTNEQESQLKSFLEKNEKVSFLQTCHTIPSYSYEFLEECSSDFPIPETPCQIKFGRRQIVLSFNDEKDGETSRIFRATRIRVWRITEVGKDIYFQFEYLMARDTFIWVSIQTSQAILMSMLLQSIGSEILCEHNNLTLEQQIMKERHAKGMFVENNPVIPRDPNKPIVVLRNAVEQTDPLGVIDCYRSRTFLLNTISRNLPHRELDDQPLLITNDDL